MSKIPRGRIIWGAVLAVAGTIETVGIADHWREDTLSEFTRWAFHVQSPIGRAAFVAGWGVFSAWFTYHILTGRPSA